MIKIAIAIRAEAKKDLRHYKKIQNYKILIENNDERSNGSIDSLFNNWLEIIFRENKAMNY